MTKKEMRTIKNSPFKGKATVSSDHIKQQHNVRKVIEHLEIAKTYCELSWSCAENIPENAMLADMEPHRIQELIDAAEEQLAYIGGEWTSIECSVVPEKEF